MQTPFLDCKDVLPGLVHDGLGHRPWLLPHRFSAGVDAQDAVVVAVSGDDDVILLGSLDDQGALKTLEILAPLEQRSGVPVVSSLPHALWAGVRLLGLSGRVAGYGTLLSR